MDPLSVTTSTTTLLLLTNEIIKYLNDVYNAPKECRRCGGEVQNLQGLLHGLVGHLILAKGDEPWFESIVGLSRPGQVFAQYEQALKELRSKIVIEDGIKGLGRRLMWKLSKTEVQSILERIERLKSCINIALGVDHYKLSQQIKSDTAGLQVQSQSIKDNTITIKDTTLAIRRAQQLQMTAQEQERHQQLLNWLSPLSFASRQNDIIVNRQPESGKWFLQSSQFTGWVQGLHHTLVCPGMPGAGKTMMAAIAIDHLCKLNQPDVGVAWVFCNFKSQDDQSASGLLAALAKQLLHSRPDLAGDARSLYERHQRNNTRPSLGEIVMILGGICSKLPCTYIVVDALDECSNDQDHRFQLIESLQRVQTTAVNNLRLMFTCRSIPKIIDRNRADSILEVRASDEDVRRFVEAHIPFMSSFVRDDPDIQGLISKGVMKAVDGMFLLARLHVDTLRGQKTKKKLVQTLGKLRRGMAGLEKAYDDARERIDKQPDGDRQLAREALAWVTYAQRPLTRLELRSALSIEAGSNDMDKDNFCDVQEVLAACAGLLVVDQESQIVRLVHYTTQEYLERVRAQWLPEAEVQLAEACLTYLSYDAFRAGSCGSDEEYEQRVADYPLFEYCGQHWGEHVRGVQEQVLELALMFVQSQGLVKSALQAHHMSSILGNHYSLYKQSDSLHVAAVQGLARVVRALLEEDLDIDLNVRDGFGRTPLWWAAWGGWESVVKLLLECQETNVNSKDEKGWTPLINAAAKGNVVVIQVLVSSENVDVHSEDENGRNALSWAAQAGCDRAVLLLIQQRGIDVNLKDRYGRTAFAYAAIFGHEKVVRLLIDRDDTDINSLDRLGRTPLLWAIESSQHRVAQLLVEHQDTDVHHKDGRIGEDALLWAAFRGCEGVIQVLIERRGLDADGRNRRGRTLLSLAAEHNHEAVVRLLIHRKDVDVNSRDSNYGFTPLFWAAGNGCIETVRLLLNCESIKVNARDHKHGQTALSWATERGHIEAVRLILGHKDVEIGLEDDDGRTASMIAFERRNARMMQLFTGNV